MNITSNMMNQGCTLASNTMSTRAINVDEVEQTSDSEVAFHRHCQATVLSAFGTEATNVDGTEGNGLTWNVIASASLPNIQSILPSGTTWQSYFTRNTGLDSCTITHDLKSILELIDKAAGKQFIFNIGFKSSSTSTPFAIHQFNTNNAESLSYNYVIGRDISFKIDGKTIKFNTTQSSSSDVLSEVTFPKSTLTILKNWNTRDYVNNIYMETDYEVDVRHDYCHIPAKDTNETITIWKDDHVYKQQINATKYSPIFNLINYASLFSGKDIISWELHVKNEGKSKSTLIIDDTHTLKDCGISQYTVVNLTDLMTISPGETNVYVFRYDIGWQKLTYSLAYIC